MTFGSVYGELHVYGDYSDFNLFSIRYCGHNNCRLQDVSAKFHCDEMALFILEYLKGKCL